MKSFQPKLNSATEEVLKKVGNIADTVGQEVYAVGGYVRDAILRRENKDIDFLIIGDGVTFAKIVKQKLEAHGLVVFEKFGTAQLNYLDYKLEFVGARKEKYLKDSRKPVVTTGTLHDDLTRRDFTINAMALSLNKATWLSLVDPFHGQSDLASGLIRTPQDPAVTFAEDPLRIMRAIRFATVFNFRIEEKTKTALSEMRFRLDIISQERITEELFKILGAKKPSVGFKKMDETGILEVVLPLIAEMKGVEQRNDYHHKDVFVHTLKVVDNVAAKTENLALRFVALFHDVAKPRTKAFKEGIGWTFHGHDEIGARMMKDICTQLRLPTELQKYAEKLIRLHLRPMYVANDEVTDSAIRRLLVQAGEEIDDLLLLCRADITSGNPARVKKHLQNFDWVVERMKEVEEKDQMRAFQSPVRGNEIMQVCKIEPGPVVGKIKKRIEDAILDGHIPNEHEAALQYLLSIKQEFSKNN